MILTDVMKKEDPTPVIVLGDLNDSQTSNTANILTEQPQILVGGALGGANVGLYTAQTQLIAEELVETGRAEFERVVRRP